MLWRRSGEQGSRQTYEAAAERISEPSAQQLRTDTAFNVIQFNKMSPSMNRRDFRRAKWGWGVMSQSVWGPEPPGSTGNTGDSFSSNNSTDDSRGGWGEVGQELRQTERGTFPSVCYVTVDRKLGSSLSVGEETHRNMADLIVQKRRLLELCERRPLAPLVALSWHRAITLLW